VTPLTYDEWAEMRELGAKLPRTLTMRERDVLRTIASQAPHVWLRPMDIGGRDGSHHSDTLKKLAKLGLVERKKYHAIYCWYGTHQVMDMDGKVVERKQPIKSCCCRGSCRYRATSRARRIYK
jgi:hypothetical protein